MERLKYVPTGKVRTKLRGSSCVLKRETTVLVNVTFKKFKPWMSRINKKHNLKKNQKIKKDEQRLDNFII
jgi:hypothetical protein